MGPRRQAPLSSSLLLRLALTAAALAVAAAQGCSINFTTTLHDFNKAGAGPNGNPDFGFLPEPANISDKKIVKAALGADSKPVYNPATGFNTTTTHSEIDFNQWWNTAAAYQQDALMTLQQSTGDNGDIRFAFSQAQFYPLDGQLLGTTSAGHNRYFTLELHTTLAYVEASAGAMTLASTGDLFVFLNGELVVNLGGVHAEQTATLVFDQLGLQDGTTYPVDIFMAQRHGPGVSPTLDVTTSVDFASGRTTAAYCAGSAASPGDAGSNNDTSLDAAFPTPPTPPADGFPGVATCNAVWGVAGGDSCTEIASKSGLSGVPALLALNPGLDCSGLVPGQLVCTGTGGAPTATCGLRVYQTNEGDSCLTIRDSFGDNGVPIKFAVLQALNPDVDCGPTGQTALPVGTSICLPATPGAAASTSRRRLTALSPNGSDGGAEGLHTDLPGGGPALAGSSASSVAAAAAVDSGGDEATFGGLHVPGLLQGWGGELAAGLSHRRLQAAGAPSCVGGTFTVAAGSCSVNCASAAMQAGLTVTQLTLLNPHLLDNPGQTCSVTAGQTLCKGCVGTVCGVKLSDEMSEFLNFPDLNLLMCGLLADCSNDAYVQGSPGAQDEQLTIDIKKPSASTAAYTAAGGVQIAAFFDPVDGYYNTNPGSILSLTILPSYYDGVAKVARGSNAGLAAFIATVVLTDAELAGAGGSGSSARVAAVGGNSSSDGLTASDGATASPTGNAVGLEYGDTSGGVGDGSDGALRIGASSGGGGGGSGSSSGSGGSSSSSSSTSEFPAVAGVNDAGRRKLQMEGPGRTLLGFRLPRYTPKKPARRKSQNPTTMVISRYRRIW